MSQTDFEKLLFCEDHVKVLKKENKELRVHIGVLESDISELRDLLATFHDLTPQDRMRIKRGVVWRGQAQEAKRRRGMIKELRKKVQDLTAKIVKLKQETT